MTEYERLQAEAGFPDDSTGFEKMQIMKDRGATRNDFLGTLHNIDRGGSRIVHDKMTSQIDELFPANENFDPEASLRHEKEQWGEEIDPSASTYDKKVHKNKQTRNGTKTPAPKTKGLNPKGPGKSRFQTEIPLRPGNKAKAKAESEFSNLPLYQRVQDEIKNDKSFSDMWDETNFKIGNLATALKNNEIPREMILPDLQKWGNGTVEKYTKQKQGLLGAEPFGEGFQENLRKYGRKAKEEQHLAQQEAMERDANMGKPGVAPSATPLVSPEEKPPAAPALLQSDRGPIKSAAGPVPRIKELTPAEKILQQMQLPDERPLQEIVSEDLRNGNPRPRKTPEKDPQYPMGMDTSPAPAPQDGLAMTSFSGMNPTANAQLGNPQARKSIPELSADAAARTIKDLAPKPGEVAPTSVDNEVQVETSKVIEENIPKVDPPKELPVAKEPVDIVENKFNAAAEAEKDAEIASAQEISGVLSKNPVEEKVAKESKQFQDKAKLKQLDGSKTDPAEEREPWESDTSFLGSLLKFMLVTVLTGGNVALGWMYAAHDYDMSNAVSKREYRRPDMEEYGYTAASIDQWEQTGNNDDLVHEGSIAKLNSEGVLAQNKATPENIKLINDQSQADLDYTRAQTKNLLASVKAAEEKVRVGKPLTPKERLATANYYNGEIKLLEDKMKKNTFSVRPARGYHLAAKASAGLHRTNTAINKELGETRMYERMYNKETNTYDVTKHPFYGIADVYKTLPQDSSTKAILDNILTFLPDDDQNPGMRSLLGKYYDAIEQADPGKTLNQSDLVRKIEQLAISTGDEGSDLMSKVANTETAPYLASLDAGPFSTGVDDTNDSAVRKRMGIIVSTGALSPDHVFVDKNHELNMRMTESSYTRIMQNHERLTGTTELADSGMLEIGGYYTVPEMLHASISAGEEGRKLLTDEIKEKIEVIKAKKEALNI